MLTRPTFVQRRAAICSAHAVRLAAVAGALLSQTGCKDLSGSQPVSAGTPDPNSYNTPDGVLSLVDGTRGLFRVGVNRFLLASGLLTDELAWADRRAGNSVDRRQLPEGIADVTGAYDTLQNLRVTAAVTILAARKYAPNLPQPLIGEMFAIQGYTEVMLADLFCSGVPLSMPRSDADIDYRPGSSTKEIYRHAITLFDSALARSSDSARIMTFARIGKGRAWLALGRYDSASAAVSAVHDGEQYQLNVLVGDWVGRRADGIVSTQDFWTYSAVDREGSTGLAYRSSGDPRTPSDSVIVGQNGFPGSPSYVPGFASIYPLKYPQSIGDSATVVIADFVEARLIQAEAALRQGNVGTWLATLNALRTDGTYATVVLRDPVTTDSVGVDIVWNAGTGGVAGLSLLADPGATLSGPAATNARVDTMFAERAAWLYLTGHRQGDLRRLVRPVTDGGDGRPQATVYPSGPYNLFIGSYGSDTNVPVPQAERNNPRFRGCLNRAP